MIIYQRTGQGKGFMKGVSEYIELAEDEDEFKVDYKTEKEAIKAKTAPGFTFERKYDTDTGTDFWGLPMGKTLIVR